MFRDDVEEAHAYCPHGKNEAHEYCVICAADAGVVILPHEMCEDDTAARCEHGYEAESCGHCWERYAHA